MSAPLDQLSRLSCTRCRDRKVRCNRILPHCGRCMANDVPCDYPARQKRRTTKAAESSSLVSTSNEALHSILDRLRRLEATSTTSSPSSPASSGTIQSPASASVSFTDYEPRFAGTASPRHTPRDFNVQKVMQDATSQVQKLRLQRFGSAAITSPIHIPKDLAKHYIASYFNRKPEYVWSNVVDREFMELLPDIIGRPHVHVDPVILVIYYCILYNEFALNSGPISLSTDGSEYLNVCYLGCLRALQAWQREACGSLADFVAAISVTKVAAECFDFDMSWKMFKLACEYCQGLNLHNLDQDSQDLLEESLEVDGVTIKMRNQRRKDIWELIAIDLFFRLTHNMPPAITNSLWKVNLPWFTPDGISSPERIESMAFLANSRMTLVFARFFAMLDDPGDRSHLELMDQTEALCREVEAIFEEYPMCEWLIDAYGDEVDFWIVADSTLTGYTSIIHMIQKTTLLESPTTTSQYPPERGPGISHSPMVINTACKIIGCLSQIIARCPRVETMTAVFGAYRCDNTFSILANNILNSPFTSQMGEQIKLLENFTNQAAMLSRGHRDITPLTFAMQTVLAEIHGKIRTTAGETIDPGLVGETSK